jgi:uncharacterized protein
MGFEWNSAKAKANLLKHRVDFADAATCFYDARALTIIDPDSQDEERFLTIATDACGRVLVTSFAFRGDNIRIISSRKASPGERRRYDESP